MPRGARCFQGATPLCCKKRSTRLERSSTRWWRKEDGSCRVLKGGKLGRSEEAEVCEGSRDKTLLSCNRGPIWPDLEKGRRALARTHTSRVTGHKEPLCQVTEHRDGDKGLEGCDMTNMRSFAGLRGDWRYSQRWLTLLICITHHSRSQRRGADQPHTLSADTEPTVCAEREGNPISLSYALNTNSLNSQTLNVWQETGTSSFRSKYSLRCLKNWKIPTAAD